jgi:hypothetical protein
MLFLDKWIEFGGFCRPVFDLKTGMRLVEFRNELVNLIFGITYGEERSYF